MAKGCDYAWDRPNMDSLRAAGIEFACRYLSYDRTGKNLTLNEARALQAKGIAPVSNWEWGERDALAGYPKGVQHAQEAARQHLACGGPPDRPIYFSVDFDAQPGDYRAVASYFEGVASVIGLGRTGVYGGYPIISGLVANQKVRWAWQTSAWSRGQWHPSARIRQTDYNIRIGGGRVDIDQSFGTDFGQWGASAPGAAEAPVDIGNPDLAAPLINFGHSQYWSNNAMSAERSRLNTLFG